MSTPQFDDISGEMIDFYKQQLEEERFITYSQTQTIDTLNKKIQAMQRNPTSSTANELIIIEELKTVKQANAALETKVAEMHAMLTTIIGVMMP